MFGKQLLNFVFTNDSTNYEVCDFFYLEDYPLYSAYFHHPLSETAFKIIYYYQRVTPTITVWVNVMEFSCVCVFHVLSSHTHTDSSS